MLKDPTPMQHLGFGVTNRDVYRENSEDEGMAAGSSFVARAMHGHPVAKFFAESAAVLVGMEVAGAIIKKGGVRITKNLVKGALEGKQIHANILGDWRKTQSVMDRLQGLHRQRGQFTDDELRTLNQKQRSILEESGNPLLDHSPVDRSGFHITREERRRAEATGEPTNVEWLLRDELQKRLVSQARRLPYELPAAYLVQRGLTDRFFNGDTSEGPDWYNPVDVISDFAGQSLKNIGGLMIPFEAGKAGLSHARNKFMTAGIDDAAHLSGLQKNVAEASVSLQRLMRLVGHDLGDALGAGIRGTERFSGAMNKAIHESAGKTKNPLEKADSFIKDVKHRGLRVAITNPDPRNIPLGPVADVPSFWDSFRKSWNEIASEQQKRLKPTSFGDSPIEDLTYLLKDLESGRGSNFAREKYIDEYKQMLEDQLKGRGVSKADAKKFTQTVRIKSVPSKGVLEKGRRVETFMEFGAGPHQFRGREYSEYLKERLAGVKGISQPDFIADNIQSVVEATDRRFASQWKRIDRKVNSHVRQVRAEVIRRGPGTMGETRPGYGLFEGPITPQAHEHLMRQTARQVGISSLDASGKTRELAQIRGSLRSRGFDPDDIYSMRGFLVQNKKISKPWNPGGFNVFGMRRLSVENALGRGYFAERTQMVQKTLQDLEEQHGFKKEMRSMRMKGVFETRSGKVLDTNVFRRKFWRTADLVANDAQVPFIHFRPFQALGWQSFRAMRQSPAISVRGGSGWHPFMGTENGTLTDSYIWTRKGGMKGAVTRVGRHKVEDMKGLYRVMPTDESTFVGRTMRQAVGDMGRGRMKRPEGEAGWRGAMRRALRIDDDQPDSFFRLYKRFKNRKTDPRNNMAFANMMLNNNFGDAPPERILAGGSAFFNRLRQQGVPDRVNDSLPDEYKHMMQFVMPKTGEVLDLDKAQDAASATRVARRILEDDEASGILDSPNINESQRELLRAFRNRFDPRDQRGPSLAAVLDSPVSSNVKTTSVTRRLDLYKRNISEYLQIRHAILNKQDLDTYFRNLDSEIGQLKKAGRITRAEATEFRAAMLSTQVSAEGVLYQLSRKSKLGRDVTSEEVLLHQMDRLGGTNVMGANAGGGRMATAMSALTDIAHGRGGSPWRVAGRKMFGGIAPYEFEGTRYNPFGAGSGTTFVPTFGTVFSRPGMRWRATRSALGFKTWDDPEAFSGMGIPVSHGFTRLNRYFSSLSLGLDESSFNGPIDMYVRGMIGRRVLPIVAGGATMVALDRQIGGMVNEKDPAGNRVYSPFFIGMGADVAAAGQIGLAGLVPGGQTSQEKEYELLHGETAVRKGRWWPLGNTPWKGGNEMYFRPSWYRRLKSGYAYTDQTFGSPMERLAFGHDFSPLRPFDPYRWERKHYKDRPYPVTGEYFTGPWGPVTSALNMTVGRVLKPRLALHEDEVAANMAGYMAVGESGMAPPTVGAYEVPGGGLSAIPLTAGAGSGGAFTSGRPGTLAGGGGFGVGGGRGGGTGGRLSVSGQDARNMLTGWNDRYLQYAGATGSASRETQSRLSEVNATYLAAVGTPRAGGRMPNRVPFGMVMAGAPDQPGEFLTGELGYNLQETLGIYGFAFASAREGLGLGNKDFIPPTPVLASPGTAYGTGRTFWDFNLGGLGDTPTPAEGEYANLEFGEIIRRFVPRPRRLNTVNPIVNELAMEHPWMPASFKMGDPYVQIPEGEMRLPGQGYERLHPLAREGNYGLATQFSILGDVAPWSDEFRNMERTIDYMPMTYAERREVEETRKQAEAVRTRHDFHPYAYKGRSPQEMGITPFKFAVGRSVEAVRHADNYFAKKFLAQTTATEDWERNNVYGATFPQWQNPIEDYLKPLVYRAADRTALGAAAGLGIVAGMMWRTPKTRRISRFVGGMAGLALGAGTEQTGLTVLGAAAGAAAGHFWGGGKGVFGAAVGGLLGLGAGEIHDRFQPDYEVGRWMPKRRRQELQVEEYADVLNYVKWKRMYDQAASAGDNYLAANFRRQVQKTMYGADLFDSTPEELAQAVPKRKREHFLSMIKAPEAERARILSTAPRLERRLYQAAWGMKVEQRPDLVEYFQEHELPPVDWEGWNAASDMESIKLKMIQQQGLDAAQMGYYPQQIQQANMINMPYPNYQQGMGKRNAQSDLQALMANKGVDGTVISRWSPFPGVHLNFQFAGT